MEVKAQDAKGFNKGMRFWSLLALLGDQFENFKV
jgi:hypothetical protein